MWCLWGVGFFRRKAGRGEGKALEGLRSGEFWLAVGTLEPRKNLRRLLRAFSGYVHQSDAPCLLAIAGGEGWLEQDLKGFIQSLGLSNHILILGYVSDQELAWLYRNCFCFVYPSLYEGFGLPVLEAMGQSAAVITSSSTSLPEVAGDAAHYIDPFDEQDMTGAFLKLASDGGYRQALREKAVIQAEKFSWEKSAEEVLHIYDEVMTLPKFAA